MADPKVSGTGYDVAERREKAKAAADVRQKRMAEFLRRNPVDIRLNKTDKDPLQLLREYTVGAEAALERELYAAGAKGGVGADREEDLDKV